MCGLKEGVEYFRKIIKQNPNPEVTALEIEAELKDLVERKILAEKPTPLYVVGRSALHLFHPFSKRLTERGFPFLYLVKIGEEYFPTPRRGLHVEEASILKDFITKGEETLTVLKTLKKKGVKIRKIFCYAVGTPGIDSLESMGLFNEIGKDDIVSVHTISNLWDKYHRLVIYFNTKLEPLDLDHVYDIYHEAGKITKEKIVELIEKCTKNVIGLEELNFEFDKALHVPKNIIGYNCEYIAQECPNLQDCLKKLLPDKIPKDALKWEFFQMKTLIMFNENRFDFRIMVYCQPHESDVNLLKSGGQCICEEIVGDCYLRLLEYENRNKLIGILCQQCIENLFSRIILDRLEEYVKVELVAKGYKYSSPTKYNPIDLFKGAQNKLAPNII